jgi:glycosyltransferase involved in cell wall biosynthesis
MQNIEDISRINYCVLIPTYNNDKTLESVVLSVMEYTSNIIVVNDGSSDKTESILERFKDKIDIVSYPINQGKGTALRRGLKKAEELGYEYAITLDSDGQHLSSEIPKLLKKVAPGEDILVIGNRDMTDQNIPPRSLFGRNFSNFWVKLETGRDLVDTQSGFRLYTVAKMNRLHYFTHKYDFELESLVRWVWNDYPVEIATIRVYYPPAAERVSHFKGFKDNFRISILNTILVIITIIYILPRHFFRIIFKFLSAFMLSLP